MNPLKCLKEQLIYIFPILNIFLPNFRLNTPGASDYFSYASEAVLEMYRQTGNNIYDDNGIMKSGVIIRHMIMPSHKEDSYKVLDWIRDNIGTEACVSLLSQYTPAYNAEKYKEINRKLMSLEYTRVIEHFFDIGLKNGFMQEKSSAESKYTPIFDLSGL